MLGRFRSKSIAGYWQQLLIVAGLVLQSVAASAATPVTLQLKWHHQFQFAGYYAALAKGFYRDAGLDVTLKAGGPDVSPINEVVQGHAQFGVSDSSLVKAFLNGQPVLSLAPIFQHSPAVLLSLGNKLGNPAAIAKAGAVSLQPGDESLELKAMFAREGIPQNKLTTMEQGKGDLQDLLDGRIVAMNAYLSNEPFLLQQRGTPYSILKPESYGMDFYGDVLFTGQSVEKATPEVVVAFRAASIKGWEYALAHPDEIIDLILAKYDTQGKSRAHLQFEAKTLGELIDPGMIQMGHSNPGRWKHIAKTYASFGMTSADSSLDGFAYEPNRKIDLTKFYVSLAIAIVVILLIGGIAAYIYRINRSLRQAAFKQAEVENRLRESERRYRIVFETAPTAAIVWREGFILSDWNSRAEDMFGWTRDEVLGRNYFDFLIPESEKESLLAELDGLLIDNTRPYAVNGILTKDGRTITCEWFNAWLPDVPGQPREMISLANDITQRKASEQARQEALDLLRKVSANVPGMLFQYCQRPDGSSFFPYVSERSMNLLGLVPEKLADDASPIFAAIHSEDVDAVHQSLLLSGSNLTLWHTQYRVRLPSGEFRWYEGQATPERMAEGGTYWHGYIADIQERKNAEERIAHMAQHDALTGLPNRTLFDDRLGLALSAARRDQAHLALMFIDLDRFKPINDTLGHAAGDLVLKEVASRISGVIREADTAARIGGDEFVVLLRNIQTGMDACSIAEKIRQAINRPVDMDGRALFVSSSIGIALYPEHGSDLIELSSHADAAMYRAKEAGRDAVVLYDADAVPV